MAAFISAGLAVKSDIHGHALVAARARLLSEPLLIFDQEDPHLPLPRVDRIVSAVAEMIPRHLTRRMEKAFICGEEYAKCK